MRGNRAVVCGGLLPVDGAQALVELLGARELPLAEDGPEDGNAADRRRDDDEHGDDGALAALAVSGASARHRRRDGVGRLRRSERCARDVGLDNGAG